MSEEFKCNECNASYAHKPNLYRHKRTAHGYKHNPIEKSKSQIELSEEKLNDYIVNGTLTVSDIGKLMKLNFSDGADEAFTKGLTTKILNLKDLLKYQPIIDDLLIETGFVKPIVKPTLNIQYLIDQDSNTMLDAGLKTLTQNGYGKVLQELSRFNLGNLIDMILTKDYQQVFKIVYGGQISVSIKDQTVTYLNFETLKTEPLTDSLILALWKVIANALYYYLCMSATGDLNVQLIRRSQLFLSDRDDGLESTYFTALDSATDMFKKMEVINETTTRGGSVNVVKAINNYLRDDVFSVQLKIDMPATD